MQIVCIKWGNKYSHDYVQNLKAACIRHIPHDKFTCFTDDPVPLVDNRMLPSDLPTWWSKIGLFRPGLLKGDVLYLDLDVVVTDSIEPFFEAYQSDKTKLWTLDDFGYSLINKRSVDPNTRRLLGGDGTVNSSVMLWRGENPAMHEVYKNFTREVMDVLHGDQNYITQQLWPGCVGLLPPGVAGSFKYSNRQRFPITVFHGDPKPDQVTDKWVKENWAA